MGCESWREELSARIDGEPPMREPAMVDAHLAGCAPCRQFAGRLAQLHRALRIGPADPVADRTSEILAAAAAEKPRVRRALALRWALVSVAALEMGLAAPDLLGRWHTAGELSTWGIATAIGFLAAAARPPRAAAMLPMLLCAALLTAFVGLRDVVDGHTSLGSEWPHLLLIVGVVLLGLLWRADRVALPGPEATAADQRGLARTRLRRAA